MHVVATAGHVDHGKSTLVRALTGQDPDRLAEERQRGLSIQLGYCWTELAVGEVAFVDVPGHERFLTTALSGLGPVPVALVVVAADDPWMPQAAEHVAALDSLGVRHAVVAVTRSDLADPSVMLAQVARELDGTSLAGAPTLAVSARTGAGLGHLRSALESTLAAMSPPDPEAPVRLWVDRRFHVRGVGTVVTGTLPAGRIAVGDPLSTDHGEVRVRGVESLGRERDAVTGTARVALALTGPGLEGAQPGRAITTPGSHLHSLVLDVRLTGDEAQLPQQPLLHVGSGAAAVRTRALGDRHARVRLSSALPLRIGDRALLRDPGSRALWGVRVLDLDPPPLQRRGAARARAVELEAWRGTLAELATSRGVVRHSASRLVGATDTDLGSGSVTAGDWVVSADRAVRARAALLELVTDADDQGLPLAAAARALDLPVDVVPALVGRPLVLDSGRIRRPGGGGGLPAAVARALRAVREELVADPFAAPDAGRLASLGLDPAAVTTLHRGGHLLHVGSSVVLLPSAPDEAVRRLSSLEQPFTTSQARQALATTRRVALPLLAHLDRTRRTIRLPDDRRRVVGGERAGSQGM